MILHRSNSTISTMLAFNSRELRAVNACRQLEEEAAGRHCTNGKTSSARPLAPVHPFVERIIGHLLTMAASDIDAGVRRATVECLLSAFESDKCALL